MAGMLQKYAAWCLLPTVDWASGVFRDESIIFLLSLRAYVELFLKNVYRLCFRFRVVVVPRFFSFYLSQTINGDYSFRFLVNLRFFPTLLVSFKLQIYGWLSVTFPGLVLTEPVLLVAFWIVPYWCRPPSSTYCIIGEGSTFFWFSKLEILASCFAFVIFNNSFNYILSMNSLCVGLWGFLCEPSTTPFAEQMHSHSFAPGSPGQSLTISVLFSNVLLASRSCRCP